MSTTNNYDVAIIGAGIGGLTAAALLSKCGLKVALVEKEPHAGGYLAGYQKRGFRFDTAIHWLNQCDENGLVTKIFKLIGSDHPACKPHQKIQRYKGETIDFLLTNDPDRLREELIENHPEDKEGIIKFFKASKKLGGSLSRFGSVFRSTESMHLLQKIRHGLGMLQFALPFIPYVSYTNRKMSKGLQKYFTNESLHKIFSAETDLLSCMVPIGWAYYSDYQHPPAGGGQVIPEWLMHALKQYGCDVFFNTNVQTINVHDSVATSLSILQKGQQKKINARTVIAACDMNTVFTSMLPEGLVTAQTIQKLQDAEMYASSVTVSVALNCPAEQLGFGEEMIHLFKENIAKDDHNSGDPDLSALTILAPSVIDKSLAPQGCGTIVIFMPAYMHQHNNWKTENNLQRGDDYKLLKEQMGEKLIGRVQSALAPELRQHILFYDVATPVTHWRYTGNKDGSMMGTKPGKKNMQSGVAKYKTPVKNLFIGGQWAELGGGVPIAAKAGLNAALMVLQQLDHTAFKPILNYFEGNITREEVENNNVFKKYIPGWKRKPTPAEKYSFRAPVKN